MKVFLSPLLAVAGLVLATIAAPTDHEISSDINSRTEAQFDSSQTCLADLALCSLDHPNECCSKKCISSWNSGPVCKDRTKSSPPSPPKANSKDTLEAKSCISDGRSCPQDRPELCCSGKCIPTSWAGPICSYGRVLCADSGTFPKEGEQCCSGKEVFVPDWGTICDVPDGSSATIESIIEAKTGQGQTSAESEVVSRQDIPEEIPEPEEMHLDDPGSGEEVQERSEGEEQSGSGSVEEKVSLIPASEQSCISDGRSCPADRPELCCSGKCVWTWFSGYVCTYSVDNCIIDQNGC